MPKIKKFNLKLSVYSIQQQLKKEKYTISEDALVTIKLLSDELREIITPAVYYQNFSVLNNPGVEVSSDAVSCSIVASTIGHPAEEFIRKHNESQYFRLAKAVLSEAADETKKFAWKLIADELCRERCALSERNSIQEYEVLCRLSDILSKIDIYATESGLVPIYSFLEVASWIPLKRKRN